jgi:arylformamidase
MKKQKLDIYGEDLPESAPLFVFIHGGYWQMPEINKENSSFIVQPFVEKGIRSIVMGYDLCPTVTLEELVDQMNIFFTWLANYIKQKGIKKVIISGHSAGAHLLAYGLSKSFLEILPQEVAVDALFLSGVFYCDELRHLKAANDKNVLSLNDQNFRALSPQYQNFDYFADHKVKAHIFAGKFESEKFQEHSLSFASGPMQNFTENVKIIDCDHFDIVEKFASDNDYELTHLVLKKLGACDEAAC